MTISTDTFPPVAGSHQSLALPVIISDPLWQSGRRGYIDTLYEVDGLSFSISSFTGFDGCRFGVKSNRGEMEEWLLNGLGRHIVIKNESLVVIWEGFVNQVSLQVGSKSQTVGQLLDIGNRVASQYTPVNNSTTPPTRGTTTLTAYGEDTDSQDRYSTITQVLSQDGGKTVAEQVRDKFLLEKSQPPRATNENFGQSNEPSVSVECLGYYYLLDAFDYVETEEGDQNLSAKLQAIVAAHPNTIFSTDYSRIATNTTQVNKQEPGGKRAKVLVEELVSIGDSNNTRYNFGVYAGRRVVYEAVVDEIEYLTRLGDEAQEVEDKANNRVFPWNVKAGKWMRTPDFLVGRSQPSSLRKDNRNTFIVKTDFSAPYSLNLNGDELKELPQMLARIQRGLSLPG